MSIFVIGDTHLSLSHDKSMEFFGGEWNNYVDKLQKNWNDNICAGDSVIIAGDVSWGMTIGDTYADFEFINNLNGKKYVIKGNHDYWWSTFTKMNNWRDENGFTTINFVHNNAYLCENIIICGSRGWFVDEYDEIPEDVQHNQKILKREVSRLSLSIAEAKKIKVVSTECEICCFIHYPPVYGSYVCHEIIELLEKEQIKNCYYGHVHNAMKSKIRRNYRGIRFELTSADYLAFKPMKINI